MENGDNKPIGEDVDTNLTSMTPVETGTKILLPCYIGAPYIHGGRFMIDLHVGNYVLRAIIDTGVMPNFIGLSKWHNFPEEYGTRIDVDGGTQVVDGVVQPVTHGLKINIQMESDVYPMTLLALPAGVEECVFGLDFLEYVQASLTIGSHTVPLYAVDTSNEDTDDSEVLEEEESARTC